MALRRGADDFEGRVEIAFRRAGSGPVVLDFAGREILGARLDGRPVELARTGRHLVLAASALGAEPADGHRLAIDYRAGVGAAGEGLIRVRDRDDGEEYVYTLNVPADAHTMMPCFDQPDLKAPLELVVLAPRDWTVVANGALAERREDGDGLRWSFHPTKPLSTYLYAFAAGPFAEIASEGARPLRFFGRRSQRELLDRHAAEVFRLHELSLAWCESYFDFPYPFAKLDFVCVPDFPFSGMEHPGAIFYGEGPVLFRQEPTELQIARRADLIAHEVSHMWFGDLVTMPWFDDVWLKEGFATYMAHRAVSSFLEGIDHERGFFMRNHPSALDTDMTSGARPIRLPLADLGDAKANYGPIIYRKGPVVLRQLELMIGSEAFRGAVRAFLRDHAYAAASWWELKRAFEDAWPEGGSGSLDAWSAAWIESAGAPRVSARLETGPHGSALVLEQRDLAGEGRLWPLATEVGAYDRRGVVATAPVSTDESTSHCEVELGRDPEFVFANHGASAYALFALDEVSRRGVVAAFGDIEDPLLRALLWQSLWVDVLEGDFAPRDFVDLAIAHLPREDDQRVVDTTLDRCGLALGRFLPGGDAERTLRLERMVWSAAEDESRPRGMRLLYLRSLADLASSETTRARLRELAAGRGAPAGLEIAIRDRWEMIGRLMLLGDPAAEPLLATMRREDDSDEGRRRAFLVECARGDVAVKEALFRRFFEDPDLPERWVQDGGKIFFATGQADLTDRFVEESLRRLPWIKEHRKIFFLPAWVDAFVRTRVSAEAAARIEAWVDDPAAPEDIEKKVRVALDHLKRTLAIRARASAG
ncbi:MAG: M1 family aminopeptidase [Planctomycetota bacterium]